MTTTMKAMIKTTPTRPPTPPPIIGPRRLAICSGVAVVVVDTVVNTVVGIVVGVVVDVVVDVAVGVVVVESVSRIGREGNMKLSPTKQLWHMEKSSITYLLDVMHVIS